MRLVSTVYQNCRGSFCDNVGSFSVTKLASIARLHELEIDLHGKCSIYRLSESASIGYISTRKVVNYYDSGVVIPPRKPRGPGLRGLSSLLSWNMIHHMFLYDLYRQHSSFPIDGYVEEFFRRFGMIVSKSMI